MQRITGSGNDAQYKVTFYNQLQWLIIITVIIMVEVGTT